MTNIAIERGRRNSWFSYQTWWFFHSYAGLPEVMSILWWLMTVTGWLSILRKSGSTSRNWGAEFLDQSESEDWQGATQFVLVRFVRSILFDAKKGTISPHRCHILVGWKTTFFSFLFETGDFFLVKLLGWGAGRCGGQKGRRRTQPRNDGSRRCLFWGLSRDHPDELYWT